MRFRRVAKRITWSIGATLLLLTVLLYGVLPPVLDRRDGTPRPSGPLPQSAILPGSVVPTTRFLERPDGRIAYDDSGGAEPLVICVPSLGDLRQEYRLLTPQLVAAGFRVVTTDLRGHGESSARWPDYSAAAVGSDLVALAQELGAGPAFVIGTSMAAGAAVWAATEAPALIAGQVLIGAFVRDYPVGYESSFAGDLLIDALFAGPWDAPAWSLYYQSLYPSTPPADLARYRGALKANLREPGRFDALNAMLAAAKSDIEPRLRLVRGPSLIIMGTSDPDFADPAGEARWIAAQLGSAPVLVNGVGHYPHAERPDEVGAVIVEFLRRVS